MRVLLLFPMADGQTGPAIKKAFENLGHEVRSMDAKLHPENSYKLAWGFNPDLVFCSRTPALGPEVFKIKKKFKDIIVCCWNVDTRNMIEEWGPLFPLIRLVDYYFVPAKKLIPKWKKLNKKTYWLSQGLQDEVYRKAEKLSDEDIEKYSCDVSFAGGIHGYHGWRQPYLEAVADSGFKFKLWGCLDSRKVYNEEHNKMVACSKINLGMSGWPYNESYVSVRDYKIMGAGGFLLERFRPGLFDLFPLGGLSTYDTPENLVGMIKLFLEADDARKEIAGVGHDFVHEKATYTKRIQQALKIMRLK